jgi:hypothetical protein
MIDEHGRDWVHQSTLITPYYLTNNPVPIQGLLQESPMHLLAEEPIHVHERTKTTHQLPLLRIQDEKAADRTYYSRFVIGLCSSIARVVDLLPYHRGCPPGILCHGCRPCDSSIHHSACRLQGAKSQGYTSTTTFH